jgi:hypothetical protein
MDHSLINLLHVLLVAPLLIAVGYNGKKSSDMLFNLTLVLGVVVLLYHAYNYFFRKSKESFQNNNLNTNDLNNTTLNNTPLNTTTYAEEVNSVGVDASGVSSPDMGVSDSMGVSGSMGVSDMGNEDAMTSEGEVEGFSW